MGAKRHFGQRRTLGWMQGHERLRLRLQLRQTRWQMLERGRLRFQCPCCATKVFLRVHLLRRLRTRAPAARYRRRSHQRPWSREAATAMHLRRIQVMSR